MTHVHAHLLLVALTLLGYRTVPHGTPAARRHAFAPAAYPVDGAELSRDGACTAEPAYMQFCRQNRIAEATRISMQSYALPPIPSRWSELASCKCRFNWTHGGWMVQQLAATV